VLVDCDNIASTKINLVFEELRSRGAKATIRLLFGNFRLAKFKPWVVTASKWSFDKVDTPSIITGKPTVDAELLINAMKVADEVDGFAIVSSDSDFTQLVSHLRNSGKYVIGFGMKHTPLNFAKAYSDFNYLDHDATITSDDKSSEIVENVASNNSTEAKPKVLKKKKVKILSKNLPNESVKKEHPATKTIVPGPNLINEKVSALSRHDSSAAHEVFKPIFEISANSDGWTTPSTVGNLLTPSARKLLGIREGKLMKLFKASRDIFDVSPNGSVRLKSSAEVISDQKIRPKRKINSVDIPLQHPQAIQKNPPLPRTAPLHVEITSIINSSHSDSEGWIPLSQLKKAKKFGRDELTCDNENLVQFIKEPKPRGRGTYHYHVRIKLPANDNCQEGKDSSLSSMNINAEQYITVPPGKKFDAFTRLLEIIKDEAGIDGWTPINAVIENLPKPDKGALGIKQRRPTSKDMALFFDKALDCFGVNLEVKSRHRVQVKLLKQDQVRQEDQFLSN